MTRHVSAENLARFRAGTLRRGPARRVRAHLDGCPRCRETAQELADIPALLAATEAPPIPAHLAARIETALATEAAHRAAGSPSMRTTAPGRPGRPGRTRLPVPAVRILTAAVVIAVIGGGGYEIISHLGPSASTSSASSSAGSSAAEPRHESARSGVAAPFAPGVASVPAYGPPLSYQHAGHRVVITPVATGTDYQPAKLAQQVTAALARTRSAPSATTPSAKGRNSAAASTPQSGSAPGTRRLASCVSRVAGDRAVRLVDVARLAGAPATVIVTGTQGTSPGQIWVVGPGCSRSASDVLLRRSLPAG